MNKKNNIHAGATVAVLLSLLLLAGCRGGNESKDESLPTGATVVKVENVGGDTAQASLSFSATVEEDNVTIASFPTAGTITALNISEGQRVRKGQHIGSVDASQAQSAYDGAKAMLRQAQDACDRMRRLYESESVPEIKWVEAQSKLQQAQSAEQIARKALADCRLYAPASGVITEKAAEVGQNVAPGMPVAKIVGIGSLKIRVSVPESEISTLSIGQKAKVEIGALGGKVFDATVVEKGIMANPLSRSFDVKLRVFGQSAELMPGMVAKVSFDGLEAGRNGEAGSAIVIPANVVQIDDSNNTFVWTVREGKACKTVVVCGDFAGDGVVVKSGLSVGDKVIVEGQHKVCNGTNVTIQ